jgi:uncharacterized protein (TIGR02271 family)
MASRKIVAVFDTASAAQGAREQLVQMGIPNERTSVLDQDSSSERTVQTPHAKGTFWTHVKEMFMPHEDRHTYEESVRRGGYMLVTNVDDAAADQVIACLERAGAIDLDQRESRWRSEGWSPAAKPSVAPDVAGTASPAVRADGARTAALADDVESESIPVVEERLRIGKREVNRGSVRVRSYIVEEPVHEEVRLREERVNVERRPVADSVRPVVKGNPADLLQERTIEVTETAEQAVVGKETRVTEQVVVSKTAAEHVEAVDDTVRRTKVDIEDDRQGADVPRGTEGNPRSPPRSPAPPRG